MRLSVIFIFLLTLTSCGRQEEFTEESSGQEVKVGGVLEIKDDDNFSDNEEKILESICSALKNKETVFANYAVDKQVYFQYDIKRKECGSPTTLEGRARVQLKTTGSKVTFQKATQNSYYAFFADYEIRSSGMFAKICDNFDTNTQINTQRESEGKKALPLLRYATQDNTIIYLKLYDRNTAKCSETSGTKCAVVELAKEGSSGDYVVVESQSITIQTSGGDYQGFIPERKMQSQVFCENDLIEMESKYISN